MKKPLETISFICVIYKHPEDMVRRLVNSIDNIMQYCSFFEYEIILFENEVDPSDVSKYSNMSPFIKVYNSPLNLGYCKGNNIAIEHATGDYLIIVNPDIIITDSLAIKWMVGTCKLYNCISGKLVGTQKWYTYTSSFPTDKKYDPLELPFFFDQPTLTKPGNWKPFKYIDGCFFCIPASVFISIGGFDDSIFPGYFGENVLAFKAFLNGYRIKDCNIDKCFSHSGPTKTKQDNDMIMKWSKLGRQDFYSKYALPNWDDFLEYLSI